MDYFALMADIKDSRSYDVQDRSLLQERLDLALSYLNDLFSRSLEREVVFSAGDEVQGLFTSLGGAFLYYRHLALIMGPGRMRGGIGCGDWRVRVDGSPSTKQDGSAFHRARRAIDSAKTDRCYDLLLEDGESSGVMTVLANYSAGMCGDRSPAQGYTALVVEFARPLTLYGHDVCGSAARSARTALLQMPFDARSSKYVFSWKRASGEVLEGDVQPVSLGEAQIGDVRHAEQSLRGLSYRLAELSSGTRQNIDKHIDGGGVLQERNAAAAFVRESLVARWWA